MYYIIVCGFFGIYLGGVVAIAPNSDVLDDLRKGGRAGFFAPQVKKYVKNTLKMPYFAPIRFSAKRGQKGGFWAIFELFWGPQEAFLGLPGPGSGPAALGRA